MDTYDADDVARKTARALSSEFPLLEEKTKELLNEKKKNRTRSLVVPELARIVADYVTFHNFADAAAIGHFLIAVAPFALRFGKKKMLEDAQIPPGPAGGLARKIIETAAEEAKRIK